MSLMTLYVRGLRVASVMRSFDTMFVSWFHVASRVRTARKRMQIMMRQLS